MANLKRNPTFMWLRSHHLRAVAVIAALVSLILTLVFVLIMLKIIRNSMSDGDDSGGRLMENIGKAAKRAKRRF